MINIDSMKCCGCHACAEICPTNFISMEKDREGFMYPALNGQKQCIDCKLCEQVCPLINGANDEKNFERGFIVQNTDENIRRQSTSGGAFTAIAEIIIENGGIVYGATYGDNFHVMHKCVHEKAKLGLFRNSKYVQSDLTGIFREIRSKLKSGTLVCFSGTPCQVEGLKCFLRRDYDNLVTVDVVCHGVSSPLIWDKYLEFNQMQKRDFDWIYFRDKHFGYKYSTMTHSKDNKTVYAEGVETDPMLRAYFTNNCDRESCYHCEFKKRYRPSDFTIWDCFHPEFFKKEFSDDKGTTSMLIRSHKGEKYFELAMEQNKVRAFEVEPDQLVFGNYEMLHSVNRGMLRNSFLADAGVLDGVSLFEKYFPNTTKSKMKKTLRIFLVKIGIYNKIKYLLFKHRRKKIGAKWKEVKNDKI